MAEVLNIPCGPHDRPRIGDLVDVMVQENDYMAPTTQHKGRMIYLGRGRGTSMGDVFCVFWGPEGMLYCSTVDDGSWSGNIVSLMRDHVHDRA